MSHKRISCFSILFFALTTSSGCTLKKAIETPQKPLSKIIESSGYIPFEIPRENWGPGNVITFIDGHERILAFDHECFDLAKGGLINSTSSRLLAGNFTVDRSNNFDVSLTQLFKEGVDVSAALNDSRVRSVQYSFTGENEDVVSTKSLKQRVQQLAEGGRNECLDEIFSSKAIVLERVLRVEAIEYSFSGEQGTKLNLDATMLDKVGLKGDAGTGYVGAASLSSKRPLLLGFRAYQFKSLGGFADSKLELIKVSSGDMERLRKESQ